MRIACLFGTFDPPHQGHVAIARAVLRSGLADRVWLVVTPRNPFKQHLPVSPDSDRLHMVRLAVAGETGIEASDAEMALPPPNYTAESLAHFRERWPEHTFQLVIGADNLAVLHRWYRPEEILKHHDLVVYPRGGSPKAVESGRLEAHPRVHRLQGAQVDISSTSIRDAVAHGRSIHGMVSPDVERYIRERALYKA